MKKSLITILGKLSILLASIIFALIIAETFIRLVLPEENKPGIPGGQTTKSFWDHDDLLGWRQLPNIKSGWMNVPVVTNSKGLRDKEYSYERTPGVIRILTLGDSYVWGWGVKLEDMFTKIIERQKNNLEVISMGSPGYSTDQEFLWLKDEGLKYKPDILLLLLHGADFRTDKVYMNDGRYKPMFVLKNGELELTHVPVPDVPIIRKFHFYLRGYSYLYIFLYKRELTKLGRIAYEKITGKPLFVSDSITESESKTSEPVNNIKANHKYTLTLAILKKTKELCLRENIQFIIAGHRMLPKQIKIIEAMAKENDIYFINLDKPLAEFSKANPDKQIRLHETDSHWNPLGHRIVAEAIFDYLDKHQLLLNSSY